MCDPCVATDGCGFCLSSLECLEGDSDGPASGMPCSEWVTGASEASCPTDPACASRTGCGDCAAVEECAWCASDFLCMTIEETSSSSASLSRLCRDERERRSVVARETAGARARDDDAVVAGWGY